MHPVLFKIGNLSIGAHSFFYFMALVVIFILLLIRGIKEGYSVDFLINFLIVVYSGGFVGCRLFYIFLHSGEVSLWDLFAFYKVGYVFYGGYIVGLTVGLIYIYVSKYNILKVLDIVTPLLHLGIFIGRIGCHLHGCCFGIVCKTNFLCIRFPRSSDVFNHQLEAGLIPRDSSFSLAVYPTQLLESLVNGILFFFFWVKYKKRKINGQITWEVLLAQAVVRFFLDFLRYEPKKLYGFTVSQFISLTIIVILVSLLFVVRKEKIS
ncbi:MAG: prolipoprotein diacylglyceryl transferase [Planctomycetota bacterium]